MSPSVFGSPLYKGLFGDEEVNALFTAEAEISALIQVEAALARAEAEVGIIPKDEGLALAAALEQITIPPAEIVRGATESAVPVPALIAALRSRLEPGLGQYLHWGATSQDIIDTGFMVRVARALDPIESQVSAAGDQLADLADRHRTTPMVGRTWYQQATPITFGFKAATWLGPLSRARERLKELRPRVLAVQFGGACGNLSVYGTSDLSIMEAFAAALGLCPAVSWHSQRDRIEELAGWLTMVTSAFGKFGGDLTLLTQSEIGEIRLSSAGGSSTMPQKQNPVEPQALVSLARFNATQISLIHQSAVHGHERDGAAWMTEWMVMPQMLEASAGASSIAAGLIRQLTPDVDRMAANLATTRGMVFAEAASFALAGKMGRSEAQALVKQVAREVSNQEGHFLDALAKATQGAIDRKLIEKAALHAGPSNQMIDRVRADWQSIST